LNYYFLQRKILSYDRIGHTHNVRHKFHIVDPDNICPHDTGSHGCRSPEAVDPAQI
jgi:hypothetical protein